MLPSDTSHGWDNLGVLILDCLIVLSRSGQVRGTKQETQKDAKLGVKLAMGIRMYSTLFDYPH